MALKALEFLLNRKAFVVRLIMCLRQRDLYSAISLMLELIFFIMIVIIVLFKLVLLAIHTLKL